MSNYASPTATAVRPTPFFESFVDRLRNAVDRLDAAANRATTVADKFLGPEPSAPPVKEVNALPPPSSVLAHQAYAIEEIDRRINWLLLQIERLESLV